MNFCILSHISGSQKNNTTNRKGKQNAEKATYFSKHKLLCKNIREIFPVKAINFPVFLSFSRFLSYHLSPGIAPHFSHQIKAHHS